MTDRKFTDEEVIKALETAIKTGDAPIGVHWACTISKQGAKDALDLINRQKAEVERLQEENRRLKKYYFTHDYHECHNEAIAEFADRLCEGRVSNDPVVIAATCLLRELTEEKE